MHEFDGESVVKRVCPRAEFIPDAGPQTLAEIKCGVFFVMAFWSGPSRTVRTFMRRFTRLALGFSKKLENLEAATHLHMAYYNFCWRPGKMRITPAMAAGVTDKLWSFNDLLGGFLMPSNIQIASKARRLARSTNSEEVAKLALMVEELAKN